MQVTPTKCHICSAQRVTIQKCKITSKLFSTSNSDRYVMLCLARMTTLAASLIMAALLWAKYSPGNMCAVQCNCDTDEIAVYIIGITCFMMLSALAWVAFLAELLQASLLWIAIATPILGLELLLTWAAFLALPQRIRTSVPVSVTTTLAIMLTSLGLCAWAGATHGRRGAKISFLCVVCWIPWVACVLAFAYIQQLTESTAAEAALPTIFCFVFETVSNEYLRRIDATRYWSDETVAFFTAPWVALTGALRLASTLRIRSTGQSQKYSHPIYLSPSHAIAQIN